MELHVTVLLYFLKISAILKATVIHGSHQVTSAPHREKDFPASSSDYSWAHCFPMSMFNCCKLLNVNCCKILIRTALPLVFDKILILEIYFENIQNLGPFDQSYSKQSAPISIYMWDTWPGNFCDIGFSTHQTQILVFVNFRGNSVLNCNGGHISLLINVLHSFTRCIS